VSHKLIIAQTELLWFLGNYCLLLRPPTVGLKLRWRDWC
jgi:hypothetical protein